MARMGELVRLQKILARAGFGSRRACESFILEGRVAVDGVVVRHLGTKADPETQTVTLDGQKAAGPGRTPKDVGDQTEKVYYILNKPRGVLCTNEDPAGRPLAIQLVPEKRRIFCVGRLDLESEGLVLLTNDGDLTHLLTHPRFGVPKAYMAKVDGELGGAQILRLKSGVRLAEGRAQGAQVRVRKRGRRSAVLELTISEGLNREVRRMLAAVGLKCRRLRRIGLGPLRLAGLEPGASRRLSREEVELLIGAARAAERAVERQAAEGHAPEQPPAAEPFAQRREAADRPEHAKPRAAHYAGQKPPRAGHYAGQKPPRRGFKPRRKQPWKDRRDEPWRHGRREEPWRQRRPHGRPGHEAPGAQGPDAKRHRPYARPGQQGPRADQRDTKRHGGQAPPWRRRSWRGENDRDRRRPLDPEGSRPDRKRSPWQPPWRKKHPKRPERTDPADPTDPTYPTDRPDQTHPTDRTEAEQF